MPKVPEFNIPPLKPIYNPADGGVGAATMKQKNLIITLCERRKITRPDMTNLTQGQASQLISAMLN